MQGPHDIARSCLEETWQERVHEGRQRSDEHSGAKGERSREVLDVRFSDGARMFEQQGIERSKGSHGAHHFQMRSYCPNRVLSAFVIARTP
jgi:hypothetical protein